jgi:hypothetical protein
MAKKKVIKRTVKKRTTKPKEDSSATGSSTPKRTDKGYWKSGQSGNPGGRPKGAGITGHLLRLGLEIPTGDTRTRNQKLADLIWKMGLTGDKYCMGLLVDRIDGPVATIIQADDKLTGEELKGKRITVERTVITTDNDSNDN